MTDNNRTDIRWIYRKFTQAGLAIILMLVVIGIWHATNQRSIEAFEKHAYMLVREVVKQAGLPIIQADQTNAKALNSVTEYLTRSEFIIDATIYSDNGMTLSRSDNALPLLQAVGLEQIPEATAINQRLFQIVEPIVHNEKTLAYLRVTFDYDAVQKDTNQFQQDYSGQSRLMLFITALIGVLFARAFAIEGK